MDLETLRWIVLIAWFTSLVVAFVYRMVWLFRQTGSTLEPPSNVGQSPPTAAPVPPPLAPTHAGRWPSPTWMLSELRNRPADADPAEWQRFVCGHVYWSKNLHAWGPEGRIYVSRPIRVSHENARKNGNHFLFEQRTARWFWVRRSEWNGRKPGVLLVPEALVPEEVKDRAFGFWCREKDKK